MSRNDNGQIPVSHATAAMWALEQASSRYDPMPPKRRTRALFRFIKAQFEANRPSTAPLRSIRLQTDRVTLPR